MRNDWFEDDNEIRLLRRGKRRLLDIVFGRTMVITLLLVLQIGLMVLGAHYLGRYYPALTIVLRVLSVAVIIYLVNKSGSATTKITWIILVMALPAFGVLLYLFVQLDIGHRYANRRVQESILSTVQYVPRQTELMARLRTELPEVHNLAEYTLRSGDYPVYENTAVTYYPMGQDKIGALIEALQSAEHFIFLEYFIVREGYMWGRILEILKEKVNAGVEVRVLYDGTCAVALLPYSYPEKLEKLGIACKMFAPLRPFVSTHYNYRDHRKILVVDGRVGFTGGVNLADEYINHIEKYGRWKDAAVMLEGEGVRTMTALFLQMWSIQREPEFAQFLTRPIPETQANGFVIPYGDCPLDGERVGEMVYIDLLNRARRSVHIITPYLILDGELETALRFAAERGVDVHLILPGKPDKWFAYALAKTHYLPLLSSGVKISEWVPGFTHAKVMIMDGQEAVVGTINLDYRSLYHHFENAVWMRGVDCLPRIEADFQDTLAQCRTVEPTRQSVWQGKKLLHLVGMMLKFIAPLI